MDQFLAHFWPKTPLFRFAKKVGVGTAKNPGFWVFFGLPKTRSLGTFWPKTPTGDGLGFWGFSNSYPVGEFDQKTPFLGPSAPKSRRETGVNFFFFSFFTDFFRFLFF